MALSTLLPLAALLFSTYFIIIFFQLFFTTLCSQDLSSALLQFKQLFSLSEYVYCDISYPKMESWKEGTDCCSWDGVTCDSVRGDVIGLDLSCSWLYGTIPYNASLFLLPHLQRLNLAFNYFYYSQISSGFGRFAKLRYLNLSWSNFEGQVPLKLSHLSQLSSLDLSRNYRVSFETSVVKRLVQNLTKLRELHLDYVDMSSVSWICLLLWYPLHSKVVDCVEVCQILTFSAHKTYANSIYDVSTNSNLFIFWILTRTRVVNDGKFGLRNSPNTTLYPKSDVYPKEGRIKWINEIF